MVSLPEISQDSIGNKNPTLLLMAYKTNKYNKQSVKNSLVGSGDWEGEYMYIHGWFMSMYDKNHYNILR